MKLVSYYSVCGWLRVVAYAETILQGTGGKHRALDSKDNSMYRSGRKSLLLWSRIFHV